MTTKVVRQRQVGDEIEPAPLPEPISAAAPPDPFSPLRAQADQLAEALKKLEQVEAEIGRVQQSLLETEERRAGLLPQEDPDMDLLGNLGTRIAALSARAEHWLAGS